MCPRCQADAQTPYSLSLGPQRMGKLLTFSSFWPITHCGCLPPVRWIVWRSTDGYNYLFCTYILKLSTLIKFWLIVAIITELFKCFRWFCCCVIFLLSPEIRSCFEVGDVQSDLHRKHFSRLGWQGFGEHQWLWPWSLQRHPQPCGGLDLIRWQWRSNEVVTLTCCAELACSVFKDFLIFPT